MHRGTLNNYLTGREMQISTAVTLAQACGVSLQYFVFGKEGGSPATQQNYGLEAEFGSLLERPAQFFHFCLLMESCQAFYLKLKVRPTLGEALSWVASVYAKSITDPDKDSLVGPSFADPEAEKHNPWDHLDGKKDTTDGE